MTGSSSATRRPLVTLTILGLLASSPLVDDVRAEEGEHHEFHKNHVGLFLGAMTHLHGKNETSFAIGGTYERRFTEMFGVEVLVDGAIGDHERTVLFAVGPTIHPFWEFKFMAGPGFEISEEESQSGSSHSSGLSSVQASGGSGGTSTHTHVNFILGVGAAYDFHIGEFSLTPTVYVDFLGQEKANVTYGVGLGYGF